MFKNKTKNLEQKLERVSECLERALIRMNCLEVDVCKHCGKELAVYTKEEEQQQ